MLVTLVPGDDLFAGYRGGKAVPYKGRSTGKQQHGRGVRDILIDFQEGKDSYLLKADVPSVKKEEITLDVEEQILTLGVREQKETEEHKEENGVTWHRVERAHNFRTRTLQLPDDADGSKISAKCENGVLCISIPKKESSLKGPRRVAIQ